MRICSFVGQGLQGIPGGSLRSAIKVTFCKRIRLARTKAEALALSLADGATSCTE